MKAENSSAKKQNLNAGSGKKNRLIDKIFIVSILILPVTYFLIFWLYANLQSFMMAFQLPTGEWSLVTMKSVFDNFKQKDSNIWISVRNTSLYFVKDLLLMPFHVVIAYFLFRKVRGYKVFQVILYLPAMVSGVVVVTAFKAFVSPDMLRSLGFEALELLNRSDTATPTILIYSIWLGWAGNMLLLGGAMARIPVEVLESARLDGINTPREIVYMIFPLLWNTLSTFLILQLTGIFGAGGPILLFANGNPNQKISTIGYWIFEKIKYTGASAYNEVSATGLVFTVVGVPIILFLRRLIEKVPTVDY